MVCLGWLTFGTYVAVVEHLGGKHHFFFFGVAPIERASIHAGTIGRTLTLLAWISIVLARVLLVLDISFYRRITGRPFHWETLLNITMVSVLTLNVMLPISLYLGLTTILLWPVELYRGLIDRVPTLFHMSALPALLSACFIQDLCFYWSHRWGHKIRFFWYLGHIAHHRVRCVSTFTVARDSIFPILQVAGPNGAFKLVLVPVIVKLLTLDYSDAMWGFVAVMVVDLLLDYSHSTVLWHLEKNVAAMRWARWIFVTPRVHELHHSSEPEFNLSDGCNFAARFSIIDRIFGTYAEPPQHLVATGLFDPRADYGGTPLRFLFSPNLRMFRECRRNHVRHWPAILFGPTRYNPPVAVAEEEAHEIASPAAAADEEPRTSGPS